MPNFSGYKSGSKMSKDQQIDRVGRDLAKLDRLAFVFDSSIKLPGTKYTIGWDGLLGLVPGVGDLVGFLLLFHYLWIARRYRLGLSVAVKMISVQLLDLAIGLLPVVGDLSDFMFKANKKNVGILRKALRSQAMD